MLKKFFFQVLTAFMGAWIAIVLAGVVAVIMVMALIGSLITREAPGISKDSALRIELSGSLIERKNVAKFNFAELASQEAEPQTLETLVSAIAAAKDNDNIKCIFLDCRGVSAAPATLHALRDAIIDFKKIKKKVFAYADTYTQGDFYVASCADVIALNPAGELQMRGIGGISLYYKGFLDKIGLEFQAVRVGEGKSAVEPYTSTEMSETARRQNMTLFSTIWEGMRRDIAASRKPLTIETIDTLVSSDLISLAPASFDLERNLVTKLQYRRVFMEELAKICGEDNADDLNLVSPSVLAETDKGSYSDKKQVAVLYACGGIDSFTGQEGIDSEDLVADILQLAEDDNVKALVLRVNSPGGSAFGSEQIWEALEQFKKSKKPFIVSMGDYAASGGYYISCGADRIYADAYTITGSIGIYGLIPNVQKLCNNLGLTPQTVATNPQAIFPNLFFPLDQRQLQAMQNFVDRGYELFVKRCSQGRKISVAEIKKIADGRPLAATTAKSLGLVDEIGGLNQAIAYAAKQAKIKDYKAVSYPNAGDALKNMIRDLEQRSSISLLSLSDPEEILRQASNVAMRLQGEKALQALAPQYVFSY